MPVTGLGFNRQQVQLGWVDTARQDATGVSSAEHAFMVAAGGGFDFTVVLDPLGIPDLQVLAKANAQGSNGDSLTMYLAGPPEHNGAPDLPPVVSRVAAVRVRIMSNCDMLRIGSLIVLASALGGCATSHTGGATPTTLVLEHVAVADVVSGGIERGRTIIVRAGRIAAIAADGDGAIPRGARRIDGRGCFVIPGMADMHVHLPVPATEEAMQRVLDLSLANSVTLIRGMKGDATQLDYRQRLRRSRQAAPELIIGGPPIAGSLTPDEARQRVRTQSTAGYDFIKLIGGFDRAAYDALMAEAAAKRIPVAGHVPDAIGLDAALAAHQASIEHLMGYGAAAAQGPKALADAATRTRVAGSWNCATLDYFAVGRGAAGDEVALLARDDVAYASDEELRDWKESLRTHEPTADPTAALRPLHEIIAALDAANAPLLVGSDASGDFVVPGFGFVDELRQLASAGLSPLTILRAATMSAGRFLGRAGQWGELRVGARADLVLLDGDPFASIEHVARPVGVMVGGEWLDRAALDARLTRWRRR